MRQIIFALLTFFLTIGTAHAQAERPRAILVLDASGSMWGQIEGKAKITIAQEVIRELLSTLPADQELGLTAYGHRRKGDCEDIETLVPAGSGTREAIANAVDAIKPVGKTPLSAAVIAAAEALKYTEEKATVILVTDGIETCNLDPCDVGRKLEETGVDFTAHVVGFDVSDPKERAQLQCLAENTGGTFRTADNARELAEALVVVSEPEPEPEPTPFQTDFVAIEGKKGPQIDTDLIWEVFDTEGPAGERVIAPTTGLPLLPGAYRVEVTRPEDEHTETVEFNVSSAPQTITVVLPVLMPAASIEAAATAPAGSTLRLGWTGPNNERDFISVAEADWPAGRYVNYTYTEGGSPLGLLMPPKPGTYQIRYVENGKDRILATHEVEVTPVEASLDFAAEAIAGATIQVTWTGPDYERDYIAIAKSDAPDSAYVNYTYTDQGSPLGLVLPPEPGNYEIRYVMNQDNTVLLRKPIVVSEVSATLEAPETAAAGATVKVTWTGPDYERDYLSVAAIGDPDSKYINYTYTDKGNPLDLVMPPEPGEYEIRYVINQDNKVLVRKTITVGAVEAAIDMPDTAPAGAPVTVNWTGPDYQRDYISVAKVDDADSKYVNYTYTEKGNPLTLMMPPEPGEYEVRYVINQDNKVLLRRPVTVTPVAASLDLPDTAPAGSTVKVGWAGPDYQRDYISVAVPDDSDGKYINYTYTEKGNPLSLLLPPQPGTYEVRYVVNQDNTVLVRRQVTTTPVTATIEAPDEAQAGGEIEVSWTGPNYHRDYISVASPEDGGGKYEKYTYTEKGSPLKLKMPEKPGTYELRYIMAQDSTVLVTRAITVK